MTTTVRQLLAHKPHVYSVSPDHSVYDALELMSQKNVGALLVLEKDELVGIFSERDYARKVILQGKSSKDTRVDEIMTPKVVCVEPTRTAVECMAAMTEKHVRHLPVLDQGRLVGVISIGDVVRAVVDEQRFTIQQLENYITSAG
jgi:CBS domain-containing protein